jgi:hypothetical protein
MDDLPNCKVGTKGQLPNREASCVMGNLDTYLDALRFLAQSSEPEATKLITAELRIREFLSAVAPTPAAQRAALEELDAVIGEVEITQYAVSFWQGIRDYIAGRLAMLGDD